MRTLPAPSADGLFTLQVDGDTLMIVTGGGDVIHKHETTYHQDCPWWQGLEGFCNYAGDGLRVALAQLDQGDRLIHIYDHRPAFYPLIRDIADPKRREAEEAARREEPGLYGSDGSCLEWQQGGNFAYVWNLDTPSFSEWGTAGHIPQAGETEREMQERYESNMQAWQEVMGPVDFVVITGPQVVSALIPPD